MNKTLFLECYEKAKKKEALLDDPAMAAYQIESLLNMVLAEREKVLPFMIKEVDWPSFENDIKYYIDIIYKMLSWQ